MKKSSKLMKASGILLVLTLATACFVGGTFAKYVSKADAADSARVAKWGVVISNGNTQDENGVFSGDAFSTQYHSPNDSIAGTVSSNVKVVAPGTSGEFETLKITGTPEVAVQIETIVDVELTGDWVDADGNFYCPLVFDLNGVKWDGKDQTSETVFETALENMLATMTNTKENEYIPAGTDLSQYSQTNNLPILFKKDVNLMWEWPYYVSEDNDIKDTYLGDIAAELIEEKTAPNIKITFNTIITQVD